MTQHTSSIVSSALVSIFVCSIFVGATFIHAQWNNPPGNPPQNNVAPPINTSGSIQFKDEGGRIGADYLVGFEQVRAGNFLRADGHVRSPEYCDVNGENCFTAAEAGAGGGAGSGEGCPAVSSWRSCWGRNVSVPALGHAQIWQHHIPNTRDEMCLIQCYNGSRSAYHTGD